MQALHTNAPIIAIGDNKTDLVSEFITLVGFPLGNTFHMGFMNAVKLGRTGSCLIQ